MRIRINRLVMRMTCKVGPKDAHDSCVEVGRERAVEAGDVSIEDFSLADLRRIIEIVSKVLNDLAGAAPEKKEKRDADDGNEKGRKPGVPKVRARLEKFGSLRGLRIHGLVAGREVDEAMASPITGKPAAFQFNGWICSVGRPKLKAS